MEACIKICFRYQRCYYSSFVTIVHQFEIDFIHIEFLDDGLIEVISTPDISYVGEKGYLNLPAYKILSIRPVLNHLGNIITCVLHMINNESLRQIEDDEYFRRN